MAHWDGATDTWRLDAAGARPGALALFRPSLEMRDYRLEFLVKIEHGGAAWVFRAADLQNYSVLRIAAESPGPAKLIRYAVIGGLAQSRVQVPLRKILPARTAFTVQMAAAGSRFSIAVNGEEVERWNGDSLPAGGVGFFAEPHDRTRLYWVRLTGME
jgi:hypothetical protein